MAQPATSRNSALKGLEASVVGQLIAEFGTFLFSPAPHDSDDVLVEVVRRDSWAALRFLRMVMLVSGVCGSIVVAFSGAFLATNWTCCAGCDRPLRWWLLLHSLLQGVQVPVRLFFWFRLAGESRTETVVADFTATPAWRASKHVSLATFGWFVLGVVWVLNANGCKACPLVYRVTIGVILQAVLRAGAALLWFRHLFPLGGDDGEVELKAEAATPAQIACLPLLCYRQGLFGAEASLSCAVCLSDYVPGEYLRQLPCNHHFHQQCADRWLAKCKTCPLCVRAIDGAAM